MSEINEDKILSITIGSRINVKSMAALSQYFNGQDLRSQGAIVRAALETLANILIEAGKVDCFDTNEEALAYINSIFPTKGSGYQKASSSIDTTRFLDKRNSDKATILDSLKGLNIPKRGEQE